MVFFFTKLENWKELNCKSSQEAKIGTTLVVSWDRYKKAGQHKNTGQYSKDDHFEHAGGYKKTDQNRKEDRYR